jgi:hypothetical protein
VALTRRFVWLALAAVLPVVLFPTWWTVLWTALVLCVLALLDVLLAPSPRALVVERELPRSVRLEESGVRPVPAAAVQHRTTPAGRLGA